MSRSVIILRTTHASDIIVDDLHGNSERSADEVHTGKQAVECLLGQISG